MPAHVLIHEVDPHPRMVTEADSPTIAVNGRFVTQPLTGVQRYAHEVVSRLAAASGWRVLLVVPPGEIIELRPGERTPEALDNRWWGGKGHLWEQARLPVLAHRAGADLLLGPAGWGPLWVRRQLVVVHDLHPLMYPGYFVPGFVAWTRLATPFLAHVPRRVGVSSEHVAGQVQHRLKVRRERIDLVPPGVGRPFTDWTLDDLDTRPGDYCLVVGADKAQKNASFVLAIWPEIHRALGLDLVLTERAVGSRLGGGEPSEGAGVRRVIDPDDRELAGLYAGALCLLWPSEAEGFGIPLLESMAVGTPFLAADVGAARELAVRPEQIQPRDPAAWVAQLTAWRTQGLGDLRAESAARGREATWERSAAEMVAALRRSLPAAARGRRGRGSRGGRLSRIR